MSDYDKNKYFRRSKFYPGQRDGSHSSHYGSRPYNKNALYKYDRDRDYNKDAEKSTDNKEKPIQQPTILLKVRTERSVSPKRSSKETEQTPTPTSIATHETVTVPPPVMTKSIKLIEDGTLSSESVQEFLQDQPDFLVVGILGAQGVGKSTIMNLIANNKINHLFNLTPSAEQSEQIKILYPSSSSVEQPTEPIKILTDTITNIKLNDENKSEPDKNNLIFKPQSLEQIGIGNYGTSGVDLFVTDNRVFLLDCQPVISAAVLDEIVQNDFKRTVAGEFLPVENCAEIHSLQLATFMLSVCHVVILVQDWFLDSNFVRFMQTAEMLKPSIPTAEEDYLEYFPHVVLIQNQATLEDFTPIRFKMIQQVYREVFSKSKLRFESGMGLGTGKIIYNLNPSSSGDPLNLFLLPTYNEEDDGIYRGHPPFEKLVEELRAQIHSVTRIPMVSSQLTEKNWLQFATRVWDTIKKSSFFLEYSKLMP